IRSPRRMKWMMSWGISSPYWREGEFLSLFAQPAAVISLVWGAMSALNSERTCPSCQKPLAPDAPLGLCPECLIMSGFVTGTEPGTTGPGGSSFVAPSVEEVGKLFPHLEVIERIGRGG